MYAVYKYVKGDKTIYVGKTSTSVKSRVWAHEREEAFEPYRDAKIYYAELRNCAEISIFETLLINNLRPALNVAMKCDNARHLCFDESILEWKEFTGRRTRAIPDEERALALALKYWKMTDEEVKAEKKKHSFSHKSKKRGKSGDGSYSETNVNGYHYIRFRISKDGKQLSFYGKTKTEAHRKYIEYLRKSEP